MKVQRPCLSFSLCSLQAESGPQVPAQSYLHIFTRPVPLSVTLCHTPSHRMSPTSVSPSWTPGPRLQDMSRSSSPEALGFGRPEGLGDSPEPAPLARPPPSDSVGRAKKERRMLDTAVPVPALTRSSGRHQRALELCLCSGHHDSFVLSRSRHLCPYLTLGN